MNFAQILDKTMKERNISNYEMSKKTGISDSLIGYWRKGERVPKADNLLNIANFLECSVDYLLGRTENSQTINGNNVVNTSNSGNNNTNNVSIGKASSEDISEITEMIKKLSLIERSKVILFIEEMKGNQ